MSDTPLRVLVRRQGGALAPGLRALWSEVEQRGWLASRSPRIVIQVGQRWRSTLVVETARSLASALAERMPSATIEIVDLAAAGLAADSPTGTGSVMTVAGTVVRSLRLPAEWFDSCFLATVTGAGSDPVARISAALDAQAEPLQALNATVPPATLAFEAHRLFASDLVVACTATRRDDTTSEACWFVSPNDIAVEMALARASGCEPSRMPYITAFAKHEILPTVALDEVASMLSGYPAPAWKAKVLGARTRFVTSRHALVEDVVAVRRNLDRIPPAIRRRLAARKRGAG